MLVQQYLDKTDDGEYVIPSCRRLLKEARLSYQQRPTAAESDAEEQEIFREELKNGGRWMPTVVCIDQTKKSTHVEPRAA